MGKSTGNGIACDWCKADGAEVIREDQILCDDCGDKTCGVCGDHVMAWDSEGICGDCERVQRSTPYEPASWAAADAWYDARKDDAAEWCAS